MRGINAVKTVNSVFKWSFLISGMTGLTAISGIFLSWFTIELAAVLVGMTA